MPRLLELEQQFNFELYRQIHPEIVKFCGIYLVKSGNGFRINALFKTASKRLTISYPRALYETVIGRKLNFPSETVDHINNDPLDNRIENLQLLSLGENSKRHHAQGLAKYFPKGTPIPFDTNGENNGMSLISNEHVLMYRRQFTAGRSKKEIVNETGLSVRTVENFLFGVSYKHVPESCQRKPRKPRTLKNKHS